MLFKILGAPLTMPIAGLTFVFQQVADMANQELYDEGGVREQLLLLQVLLEEGDIDEDEFAEREAELLARLREIKERMCTEVPAQPDPTSLIDGDELEELSRELESLKLRGALPNRIDVDAERVEQGWHSWVDARRIPAPARYAGTSG